jgi:hypothetical protein
MRNRAIGVGIILISLASAVRGAGYTSPDGRLTFTLPADGSLVAIKNPPAPATAMWQAADGARLIYITQPIPPDAILEKAGLEAGTLGQLPDATLLWSTQKTVAGLTVFTIEATSNYRIYIRQVITSSNGKVYKVMAAGTHEISTDPHFAGVFQSLAIQPAPASVPAAAHPANSSHHTVSVRVGEIGIVALVIAGVALFIRRRAISSRRKYRPYAWPGK